MLEHAGLRVENPESLTLYRQGGAQVEGNRVYTCVAMAVEAQRERPFILCITSCSCMVSPLQLDTNVTDFLLE